MSHPKKPKRRRSSTIWRTKVAAQLKERGHDQDSIELMKCGDPAYIRSVKICSGDPEHFNRAIGCSCHLRICPECCHRDGVRLLRQYYDPIAAAAAAPPHGWSLKHIVLTTHYNLGDPDIKKHYRQVYKNADLLFEYFFGKNWQRSERGLIYSTEFGEQGQYLHLHCLIMCEYIDQSELSRRWEAITGDKIVWIDRVNDIKKSVQEMVKYATKLTVLEPEQVVQVFECIKGSRRIRSRGIFYGLPAPEVVKITNCKECGAPIIQISPVDFADWQSGKPIYVGESNTLLHLIIGNKSNKPPPQTRIKQRVSADFRKWNNATNGLDGGITIRKEDVD